MVTEILLYPSQTTTDYALIQKDNTLLVACPKCQSSALTDYYNSSKRKIWHKCGACGLTKPSPDHPAIGNLSVAWTPLTVDDDIERLACWIEAWTGVEVEVSIG